MDGSGSAKKAGPKKGATEEGGRRHRAEQAVQIRKDKKEEQLSKRRAVRTDFRTHAASPSGPSVGTAKLANIEASPYPLCHHWPLLHPRQARC